MSSQPRMYVSASFYHGILTEDETEQLINELDELGLQIVGEYDDSGIVGYFAEDFITVFAFLTNSWGDAIYIEEFKTLNDDFVSVVQIFCANKPKCKMPSFRYGATFY